MISFLAALLLGMGLRINQYEEGEGSSDVPSAGALKFDLSLTGVTSQAFVLFGGV